VCTHYPVSQILHGGTHIHRFIYNQKFAELACLGLINYLAYYAVTDTVINFLHLFVF